MNWCDQPLEPTSCTLTRQPLTVWRRPEHRLVADRIGAVEDRQARARVVEIVDAEHVGVGVAGELEQDVDLADRAHRGPRRIVAIVQA